MKRRDDKFPDNGFEAWGGYMHAKVAKLEEQYCMRAGKEELISTIFNGISIFVNGFTIPSSDELKTLMTQHGGVYHTYQRSDDFIIASNLPDTKVKNMTLTRVVRPEWITDSIASNKLLDYKDYLLYKTPRNQRQLNFKRVFKSEDLVDEGTKHPLIEEAVLQPNTYENNGIEKINALLEAEKPSTSNNQTKNEYLSEVNNLITKPTLTILPKTAADPNFISEFYNNSRLHHISQLGACFKQHINDLRENTNFSFPIRAQLKERILSSNSYNNWSQLKFQKNKVIMHIDMDCFFVSVGLRNRPDLKGKPVAVTHSKGGQGRAKRPGVDRNTEFNLYRQKQAKKISKVTGKLEDDIEFESRVDNVADEDDKFGSMSEIASCSYEARAKGIGNGMFMGPALKLCPDLQTIPYDFEGYKEVAYTLYNSIAQYTLDIEAVSCDEMYVDCTELLADMNINVQSFAAVLREEIKNKTGCPCSAGFGGNRLQARLATKKAKPDGQFFLTEDLIEDFMFDIKLKDLPGVGRQTAQKLESLGHLTCGSLQTMTLASLKCQLGVKSGAQLFDQCRGRDPNPLVYYTVRKSVSAEVNYGIRFESDEQCTEFLKQLSAEVYSRMHQFKVLGKCITLKLMVRAQDAPIETAKFMGHGFCNIINKSTSLNNATNDVEVITKEVITLYKKQNIDCQEMRGIGIQMTKLEPLNVKITKGAINKFFSNQSNKLEVNIKHPASDTKAEAKMETIVNDIDKAENIRKNPSTPTKAKIVNTSLKKSPILPVKSPGKRRGRPPKHMRLQQSSKNVMSKFLLGTSVVRDIPYRDPMIKDTVPKVVQELPKLPPVQPKPENPKGLLGLPWKEVREMFRAWLESGQTPLQCDIDMITEYLQEMVVNKNIDKLYVLIKFLRRMTTEIKHVAWSEVYEHILEQVQNAMIAVYGKKLHVPD